MIDQGKMCLTTQTQIRANVWIGKQKIVLDGKEIGSHSVIDAGAVVSQDIPDYVS